ncbi:AcrB/AcrD/AcrF family protein [Halobacillus halophilus]|uniref:Acriflavin resistance protein family transporter n=1 Tax=Halobacillus halophilus (strain ATCC 35676 / DSM 2266 / JCM 20832 / KCTC 3685 / LMG 17431 / NBRC 102448 / NCIMB 2269) TaxID=866895 RepID=I0JN67_HALH3|nr:efflux RND transporter permease subunit [Halobacillus halophilus]ASF39651.1 AcrB/AcrD/AcrF family protein [Halobacillus halophilus]CCG45587.1 acriflavin resistance protein family transporter [Halobacillus halophilus DSM 2266]
MSKILQFNKIIWVFIILLIFTGIFTYLQLPKREIPEINVNVASISTVFPGATPQEVERTVINPLETELLNIQGVDQVTSASTTGFGSITTTLTGDAEPNTVNSKIRQVVSDVSRGFPGEVQDPDVNTDLNSSSVASYHLLADNEEDLYNLRDTLETWRTELTGITGVESILIKGLPEQKVSVSLDNTQLKENQLSPSQVISSIQNEIAPAAIGTEQEDNKIYQLILDKYSNIDELSQLSIGQNNAGESVTIEDIGSINVINEEVDDLISYDGKAALSVTVLAKEGVNISALQDSITSRINTLSGELPAAIEVDQFYTQSTIIEEVFTNLITSFSISFFAVIVIMVLGLPISSAILVALSIPISIIIGLIPLPYVGVDLNQISIIGMIIAIGILVDDAIVVNDNIQRRFQLGDGALEGTIRGIKEVRKSIVTSTLMIIFSFFPLTFLSGSNGDFIRALPTVLIFTILASTIIALTFIPTVQYARKRRQKKQNKSKAGLLGGFFNWIERVYADSILPKTTKKPWLTALTGLILCALLATLVVRIPFEFFPSADRPEVTISVEYPQGTPIEETQEQLEEMKNFLTGQEDNITESAIYTGTGLPGIFNSSLTRSGENTGQLLVRVDRDETSASTFINDWEEPLREEFSNAEVFLETIVSGPPPSPPVQVKIQGPELEPLIQEARNARDRLADIDEAEIATINAGSGQPFTQFNPDRDKLADNNIPISQITSQLQLANTGVPLGTFDNGVERLPLEIILDDGDPNGVNLENLTVVSQQNPSEGQPPDTFSLDELISQEEVEQVGAIPHLDGKRTITVEAYPKEGAEETFTSKSNEVVSAIKEDLPDGYSLVESGETDAQTEFFVEVAKLFVIVLFLIYLTIAIQFNSLLMPVLITGTVFLAVTGAIIGLFVSGQPLSFLAVLGIVSLSGIVVRNSVILIEFIEQNKETYSSTIEAVIEAGRARVRPIVLTSLTSIAALTPIIFTGDVLFKPLAVSIVSGLLFSTILTLLLVPAFYLIIVKITGKKTTHE